MDIGTNFYGTVYNNMLIAHKRKTNAKNFVVRIMSRMRKVNGYTMKEDDSNKLLIEDVGGGEALSFWSRIAARHIHQPRIVIL
jgi:hypothetical protein